MCLSVAPIEASIPSERSRRCASTVKPATAIRAIRIIVTVTRASTMVSGLSGLLAAAVEGVWTFGPIDFGATPGASNRTVT